MKGRQTDVTDAHTYIEEGWNYVGAFLIFRKPIEGASRRLSSFKSMFWPGGVHSALLTTACGTDHLLDVNKL